MKNAIIVNRSELFVKLYKDLLELKGYNVQTTHLLPQTRPLVDALFDKRLEKVLLLADCCKDYSEHQCISCVFQGYAPERLSRLSVLLTSEHNPLDCPKSSKSGIPHVICFDVKGICNWIDSQ